MFIVFEGGEGVGKSTQLELLFSTFIQQGISCIKTREPGGTPFAENIRSLFKQVNSHGDAPLPMTELYLVSAARAQHLEKVILPAVEQKKIILCDRFLDSTYVYQCVLGNIKKEIVDQVSHFILKDFMPDLTFVFTCDEKTADERRKKQQDRNPDRLDSYQNEIHTKIRRGYEEIVTQKYTYPNGKNPLRILIDANRSKEDIFDEIRKSISEKLHIL